MSMNRKERSRYRYAKLKLYALMQDEYWKDLAAGRNAMRSHLRIEK